MPRELAVPLDPAAGRDVALEKIMLKILNHMEKLGIDDPNFDIWLSIFTDNVELAKKGVNAGGNPNMTFETLISNHLDWIEKDEKFKALILEYFSSKAI
jgi:hypothetical protein